MIWHALLGKFQTISMKDSFEQFFLCFYGAQKMKMIQMQMNGSEIPMVCAAALVHVVPFDSTSSNSTLEARDLFQNSRIRVWW